MLELNERTQRERDFHNARFTHEVRQAQDKYYAAIKHGAVRFHQRVEAMARDRDVLEYGCGDNNYARELAPIARSIIGIDISDVAIAAARESIPPGCDNLSYEVMDAEDLSLPAGSLDLVFGRGIIHHLDLERSFRTIARVLRPDGRAIQWEPLGHNALLNLYRRVTPSARTPDEHPLLAKDFDIARRFFGEVEVKFYGLTTVLSVPIRSSRLGDAVLAATAALDRALFKIPGLRWQAWYCWIELSRPLP